MSIIQLGQAFAVAIMIEFGSLFDAFVFLWH